MPQHLVACVGLSLCSLVQADTTASGVVTQMTPAMIAQAIRTGMENPPTSEGYTIRFDVGLTTPYSRVAKAAGDAKRKLLPFTPSDVTKEMVQPVVIVLASGGAASADIVNNVEHIVVAKGSADDAEIIQPLKITPTTGVAKNKFGMTLATFKGVTASFPLSVLLAGYEFRVIPGDSIAFGQMIRGGKPIIIPLTSEMLAKIR